MKVISTGTESVHQNCVIGRCAHLHICILLQPWKATSVIMSDLLIRSELHSNGSDSPQVQNPLSTDNNKDDSVVSPPKPTINLVPKTDVPGGDSTTS